MTRFFIRFSHGFSIQAYIESAIMYTIMTSRFITKLHIDNFSFEIFSRVMNIFVLKLEVFFFCFRRRLLN